MLSWPAPLRLAAPWRALLVLLLVVVSWFAFAPVQFDDRDLPLDKLRHLAAFGALAWVAAVGFAGAPQAALRVPLGLFAYGVLIELVQAGIPGRTPSAWDVVADAVGIALGLALARWLNPRRAGG